MSKDIIPTDTRYVPIPQQPYCCAPACLTMIMIRRRIKPIPQELLGYHLGLVIPTSKKDEFWNPRHAAKPVVTSGFGTQIQNEKEFGMQKALLELNIPLEFEYLGADRIDHIADFETTIRSVIAEDGDVMVCLNWGVLTGQEKNWGHILCVDRIDQNGIRLIDTDIGPKWRIFSTQTVFQAVKAHGNANYGGLWIFRKI